MTFITYRSDHRHRRRPPLRPIFEQNINLREPDRKIRPPRTTLHQLPNLALLAVRGSEPGSLVGGGEPPAYWQP
jgi:hypothetical protein